jgi:NADPH-dependent 2,4-dienoyl-CoA reductase/sulfur reductase-like enzyme
MAVISVDFSCSNGRTPLKSKRFHMKKSPARPPVVSMNPSTNPLRLVVVGGVAAGASAAARARRLSEAASITLIERGPDVSFANCGLPYFIGGEIKQRDALSVQTPQTLKAMLNLDIRTGTEAIAIDRVARRVQVRDGATGETTWITYDKLVLAPGASPLRPALPGIDDARIHTLRSLQDMDRIKAEAASAGRVVIIGAGFIGLEMAEQFVHLGKQVTLVELQDQVLPPLDRPMALLMEDELRHHGVELVLGDGINGFEATPAALACRLNSGRRIEADLVILSIGVRPDTALARECGLALGPRGHIRVDRFMQTSDRDIHAAGDAVETQELVTGEPTAVPLGGPANRQGRLAADHIFRPDQAKPYAGALGTAIVRAFGVAAGLVGWSEKRLQQAGRAFRSVTVNDNHHASYFPGAKPILLKLLWDPADDRVLGAQVTGLGGVDKRLDVIVCALGKTAYFAARILAQRGFAVASLTGGLRARIDPRSPAKLPTP